VIDFKTSLDHKPSRYDDQLGIYAVAAARGAFGDQEVALPELVWPGIDKCPVDQAKADVSDEALVLSRVAEAAAIVAEQRFAATPGQDTCRGCAFTQGCPASMMAGET